MYIEWTKSASSEYLVLQFYLKLSISRKWSWLVKTTNTVCSLQIMCAQNVELNMTVHHSSISWWLQSSAPVACFFKWYVLFCLLFFLVFCLFQLLSRYRNEPETFCVFMIYARCLYHFFRKNEQRKLVFSESGLDGSIELTEPGTKTKSNTPIIN